MPIPKDREVFIFVAVGPLNARKEANAQVHTISDHNPDDIRINFSDSSSTIPETALPQNLQPRVLLHNDHVGRSSMTDVQDESGPKAWPTRKIVGEHKFRASIGPTGGKRGYTAITGVPSWGIAWYINDLLIPEITVERGLTYEFLVEGGNDPSQPASYHPIYITDSPEGGLGQKTGLEARKQKAYAGVEYDEDGNAIPTAVGRYCEWKHRTVDRSSEIETFEEYKDTLIFQCEDGEPGYMNWTVPMNAPNTLYYQCFTHNNLGWRINVVDAGASAASEGKGLYSLLCYMILSVFSLVMFQAPEISSGDIVTPEPGYT
ncbi:GH17979 [Drosophila grimshawi]|uniref:GH17979 n=1 Tax=Drosophila grimshawi TaxID=7222 RepID=B4K142_DROGR|nr:GH17979 [Drosophila grimshawi]